MPNWYATRGKVKDAAGITGATNDARIDEAIEAASRDVDALTRTWFIPKTQTRKYDFSRPQLTNRTLLLDAHLLSVTTLKDKAGGRTLTENTDFRLMPRQDSPPYHWIEKLVSSSSEFESGSESLEDAFEIAGSWGYSDDTEAAGNLNGAIAATTATALSLTRGDKADVGDTLLIGTEQVFLSARGDEDLNVNTHGTTGAMTASTTDKTVTLASAPTDAVRVGEVLRIGSEQMLVEAINSTTSFEVKRAHDGTTLAAHSTGDDVYVQRSYTMQRGVNGTTAATAADDAAVTRYRPEPDVVELVTAIAVSAFAQHRAQWGRTVERGETAREFTGRGVSELRRRVAAKYRRHQMVSV